MGLLEQAAGIFIRFPFLNRILTEIVPTHVVADLVVQCRLGKEQEEARNECLIRNVPREGHLVQIRRVGTAAASFWRSPARTTKMRISSSRSVTGT